MGLVMLRRNLRCLFVPQLVEEIQAFNQNIPEIERRIEEQIGPSYPFLAKVLTQVLALPASPGVADFFKQPLVWGKIAVGAVTSLLLVLILTLYFLVDGKRLYAWLLAYVPRRYRKRMSETVPEVSDVVRAYVQGQLLTSFLAAAVSFAILISLRVPAALPLALLAGLGDVVPILGMVVSTVPAVLLALTVSPQAASSWLFSYLAYNALETYGSFLGSMGTAPALDARGAARAHRGRLTRRIVGGDPRPSFRRRLPDHRTDLALGIHGPRRRRRPRRPR